PDDDYDNKYSTGDAHGKINSDLLVELLDGIATDNDKVPVQFRYYQRLRQAIAVSSKNESSAISKLMKHVKEVRKDLEYRLKNSQLSEVEASQKKLSLATAYWWVAHNEIPVMNHALGKASFPFLLFPDLVAEQLLRERYDFNIYGFQHDEAPSILQFLPITKKTKAILLGTYSFKERYNSVLDPDSKGRIVMVNGAGWIALKLRDTVGERSRTIDFVDNDRTVYAFVKDGKVFTIKGVLVVYRLLNPDEFLYLKQDGFLQTSYERPQTRKKQIKAPTDTVKVLLKNGLDWLNAGMTPVNSNSLEIGQILSAQVISPIIKTGQRTLRSLNFTVKGAKEKWYVAAPSKNYPPGIPSGDLSCG
ncbi:MAG: hypothetical protein WBL95_19310, partial [Microcoleus sp.]